jgi:hypothetical protein
MIDGKAVATEYEGRLLCAQADLLPGNYDLQRQ